MWCCTSLVDINLILVVPFFLFSVMCGAIFSTALNPKWFEIEELFISLPPGPNWGWFWKQIVLKQTIQAWQEPLSLWIVAGNFLGEDSISL